MRVIFPQQICENSVFQQKEFAAVFNNLSEMNNFKNKFLWKLFFPKFVILSSRQFFWVFTAFFSGSTIWLTVTSGWLRTIFMTVLDLKSTEDYPLSQQNPGLKGTFKN